MSTGDKISSDELTDLIGRVRVSFGGFEDADALIAEAEQFVARLAEVEAERDAARAEEERYQSESRMFAADCTRLERALEAARPVVEAADAVVRGYRLMIAAGFGLRREATSLVAAVDLYRSATTRNLDSDVSNPSLAAETLPTTEEKP